MTRRQFHRLTAGGFLFGLAASHATAVSSALPPDGTVGWYGGDWQPGIPAVASRYRSANDISRVYDDFVVPYPGWTVVGLFSINQMNFEGVTQASWEIQKGMSPGHGGIVVASGVNAASQTLLGNGPKTKAYPGGLRIYRIRVSGFQVYLPPGRYWLSIAPMGAGESFLCPTLGANAKGEPHGARDSALMRTSGPGYFFRATDSGGRPGKVGRPRHFSLGVLLAQ